MPAKRTELELFAPEEGRALSPRLEWLRRYEVIASHVEGCGWIAAFDADVRALIERHYDEEDIDDAPESPEDRCRFVRDRMGRHMVGFGDTHDDAIADLARKQNVRLWNEERGWD